MKRSRAGWFACTIAALALLGGAATAADIRVVSSGGFAAAYRALTPGFEASTGDHVETGWGPSMGATADAVPQRLARGEPIDVLIMVGYALDGLIKQGKVLADSRVDLAQSGIGVVVRQGTALPDISSPEAFRATVLAAKSIAYSDSASGVYIQNEMFKKMGVEDLVRGHARMIPAEPVGEVVARGEADLGFQQISELKPIKGITLVGPLPPSVQQITVFAAGVVSGAKEPAAARALIGYLAAPAAAKVIAESGMEPLGSAKR